MSTTLTRRQGDVLTSVGMMWLWWRKGKGLGLSGLNPKKTLTWPNIANIIYIVNISMQNLSQLVYWSTGFPRKVWIKKTMAKWQSWQNVCKCANYNQTNFATLSLCHPIFGNGVVMVTLGEKYRINRTKSWGNQYLSIEWILIIVYFGGENRRLKTMGKPWLNPYLPMTCPLVSEILKIG